MERKINQTSVRLEMGDVTELDSDAFVFYARSDLQLGSGYGTAIMVRGGPEIKKELESLAPVQTGEAVVTSAGELKAKSIIHAVGPKFQEPDTEGKLRKTMSAALKAAEEHGIERLAFPPMGSGFYGVPPDICADVMVSVLKAHLSNGSNLKEVVFCPLHSRDYDPIKKKLESPD